MPQSSAPTIAVIGAGFSGVMTALHLLSRSSDTQIMLFETGAARDLKTETTVDALRARFGPGAVVAGRALKGSTRP